MFVLVFALMFLLPSLPPVFILCKLSCATCSCFQRPSLGHSPAAETTLWDQGSQWWEQGTWQGFKFSWLRGSPTSTVVHGLGGAPGDTITRTCSRTCSNTTAHCVTTQHCARTSAHPHRGGGGNGAMGRVWTTGACVHVHCAPCM